MLLLFTIFFAVVPAAAQDSLSIRDASEIRYKAEKLVRTELNELLNSLSNSSYETQEIAESIRAAYSESRNRIFRDSLVMVEPDVNPAVQSGAQSGDELVEKYLRDIDILYKKSDSPTVEFSNIRCSPVKKKDNIYVKVYFNSQFKGKCTVNEQDYTVTNRIAEITAEKEKSQWRLRIVRLAFFDPADTAGDITNNIPIKYDRPTLAGLAAQGGPPEQERVDSETPARLYTGFIEKARLLENDRQYKEAIESYQNAIREKPEESARLQPLIRELMDQFAILSDLQEKYNAGYIKEALKGYTDAIKKDPNNSDYYLGRGRCYERLKGEAKSTALALKDYTRAYDLDHNNLPAILCRADLYARTGDYFKALSDYKIYLTVDKSNTGVYEKKSEMHVRLKLNADAMADLDEALAVDPKAAHVYFARGLLLYNQNEMWKAGENFTTCLRIDPSNAPAFFNRGRCKMVLNKIPEAIADFASARAHGLDSNDRRVISGYAEKCYDQGVQLANANKTDSAITYIDYAISIEPASPLYRLTRGDYYYSLGNFKEAIANYDLALECRSSYLPAYTKRGIARCRLALYKPAIADFEYVLRSDPSNLPATKGEGDAYRALKDYRTAVMVYENALRLAEGGKQKSSPALLAELFNSLAICYFEQGEYENAVINGKKAIANDRNYAEAYFNRGYAYYKQGQLAAAIDDWQKAVALDDKQPQWYYVLGKAYQDKKDPGNAAAQFAVCVQKDTGLTLPDAVYQQGYCHYVRLNYAAALPFYSRYLGLHPDSVKTSFAIEMGVVYLNTGKYDSAYSFFRKAYQQDSTNGYASYGIGSSLALQRRTDESIAWFERSFRKKTPGYGEIKKDRLLADLRNNKKFKELLKKYF